jgi:hypothetical protein
MATSVIGRRAFLGAAALPWLGACSTPLPLNAEPPADAAASPGAARLADSAQAHGLDAYRQLRDINVAYDGQWRALIDRIQPVVVDKGFRGSSQERLMPAAGIVAQAYTGPSGRKHVVWSRRSSGEAEVGVWFNGTPSADAGALAAAALVADCYGLFLLGPLWLVDRAQGAQLDGTARIDGRLCDVVQAWLRPGFGQSRSDRVTAWIDRADSTLLRVRFTLEGYVNTQGAVAEVDTFDHERRFGVLWPLRSHERVVHPLRLPAHDWHITGLDVNRGYDARALQGPEFTGSAAAPA